MFRSCGLSQTARHRSRHGTLLADCVVYRLGTSRSHRKNMARSVDVLVVDNSTLDANALLLALARVAPHARVLRLRSGDEALQFLFSRGLFAGHRLGMPRLVLLSADMPTVSGTCVLDLMRAHPLTARVPVVLLCVDPYSRAHLDRRRFRPDAYVVKQWDLDRYCVILEGSIRRWLPWTVRGVCCKEAELSSLHGRPEAGCYASPMYSR
jgi:two-component system, response regulator